MRKPSWFQVSDGILVFLSFLLPLFFLPWTLDVLEEQKQTLLVVLVSFALFFKVGGLLVQKKISLRLEGLLFLPFFFLSSVFLSALFSGNKTGDPFHWSRTVERNHGGNILELRGLELL